MLTPDDADLRARPLQLPRDTLPVLFVVIDTEEEFDWDSPFSRRNINVRSMRSLSRVQRLFERFSVVPTYAIDYPIATQPESCAILKGLVDSGRCCLGAHLHPWVNPPFAEEVNARNSYACNLPPALEREKLERLVEETEAKTGVRTRMSFLRDR